MNLLDAAGRAFWMALTMFWQIFWGLSLEFLVFAIVENVVSRHGMARLLPDASPRSVLRATLLGAASSSCSYAAARLCVSKPYKWVECDTATGAAIHVASRKEYFAIGLGTRLIVSRDPILVATIKHDADRAITLLKSLAASNAMDHTA